MERFSYPGEAFFSVKMTQFGSLLGTLDQYFFIP